MVEQNQKKTVLFMRGYFMPETAASNQMCVDYIQALSQNGYRVRLLCPVPTRGVSEEVRKAYKKKKYEQPDENITIRRFWLPSERGGAVKRAIRYLMQNVYQVVYALTHSYDALFLYSTPPTNGAVGALLRILKKKPFIYNLHDVFPDSLVNAGMTREGSLLWKLGNKMEQFTYRHADRIVTVSDGIRENILKKGVPEDKIQVVYNWVDANKILRIPRSENTMLQEFGIDGSKFLVTYAGNIGEAQGVMTILESAVYLKDNSRIRFVIIGNGAKEEACKQLAAEQQLNNVTFVPMQGPDRLSEVYSLGDVSLVSCKAGFGTCGMPSKTGSIMSASTAVVASFDLDSELTSILTRSQAGVCVEPGNGRALADAILQLSENTEVCETLGKNGRKYLEQNMTKEICTQQLVSVVKSTVEM